MIMILDNDHVPGELLKIRFRLAMMTAGGRGAALLGLGSAEGEGAQAREEVS